MGTAEALSTPPEGGPIFQALEAVQKVHRDARERYGHIRTHDLQMGTMEEFAIMMEQENAAVMDVADFLLYVGRHERDAQRDTDYVPSNIFSDEELDRICVLRSLLLAERITDAEVGEMQVYFDRWNSQSGDKTARQRAA